MRSISALFVLASLGGCPPAGCRVRLRCATVNPKVDAVRGSPTSASRQRAIPRPDHAPATGAYSVGVPPPLRPPSLPLIIPERFFFHGGRRFGNSEHREVA
jgi:hypothetical protein